MSSKFIAKLMAAAIAVSPIAFVVKPSPAAAQVSFSIGFGYFYNSLAPYGRWYHHPRWGDVWQPVALGPNFRPYTHGYWDYTAEYGWVWVSDYAWGDIAFHYGRWVYDPFDGWLWIPGYVWAPAWVIWRGGNGYVGWFPMPPDEQFLIGAEVYRTRWDWDDGFGYTRWYGYGPSQLLSFWVFVDDRHFADRDYIRYVPPRNQIVRIVNNTTNITNYVTVNNRIVNRSIDVNTIERASGRRIVARPAREVLGDRAPITPVDVGRQIQERERRSHGGNPNASARARLRALPEPAISGTPGIQERGPNRAAREAPRAEGAGPNANVPRNELRGRSGREAPGLTQPNARERPGAVRERNRQGERALGSTPERQFNAPATGERRGAAQQERQFGRPQGAAIQPQPDSGVLYGRGDVPKQRSELGQQPRQEGRALREAPGVTSRREEQVQNDVRQSGNRERRDPRRRGRP